MQLEIRTYLNILIPFCILVCLHVLLNIPNEVTSRWLWLNTLKNLNLNKSFTKIEDAAQNSLSSSVFCRGSNHTNRLCLFKNLCYEPNKKVFVFFLGSDSIRAGFPPDRYSPALADFSSVEDHNTLYFNYVELPESAAKKFNVSLVDGHALAFKRFNPENLMHVFHDDLLPIYATLQEMAHSGAFLVIADEWQPGPYVSLYDNFLPKPPMYLTSLSKDKLHCFSNFHIGLNKLPTWYQYGFKIPQGPLPKPKKQISQVIFSFRNYFLQRFFELSFPENKTAILFTRKHNRKIINQKSVSEAISKLSNLPTKVLSLDDYSVLHIIHTLRNCHIAVGMHGSLLVLSLFLQPGSILIEAFPFGIRSSDITPYRRLCQIIGVKYVSWENTIEANNQPHPEYPTNLGGLADISKEERQRVSQSMVTPFLCCGDRVWLFRIYQDTTIDIDSFTRTLQQILKENIFPEDTTPIIIDPGEVENISCSISRTSLVLDWVKPWNLNYLNNPSVEYEVWLQDIKTEEVKAFIVKKARLVISVTPALYYAWVRCYVNNRVGPFNSIPAYCNKA